MAKIYETKEDFERDKLKEQAQGQKHTALLHTANASGFVGLGAAVHLLNAKNQKPRDWLSWLGSGFIGAGLFEMVQAWMTKSKAHTLDLQRERLGPEKVILPPETGAANNKDCCCKAASYRQSVKPTALLDHAEKTASPSKTL